MSEKEHKPQFRDYCENMLKSRKCCELSKAHTASGEHEKAESEYRLGMEFYAMACKIRKRLVSEGYTQAQLLLALEDFKGA